MSNTSPIIDSSHNPQLLDLQKVKDAVKVVSLALNKSSKAGVFTLDEAYTTRLSLSQLEKAIDILEQYQTNHVNHGKD